MSFKLSAFTVGDQPTTVPASVAKRKRAGPLLPFWLIGKSVALLLNTVPVGPPATATVSATFAPAPEYSVEVFVPLFADHHGVVGPADSPQALTRFVSAAGAGTDASSETSACTVYGFA